MHRRSTFTILITALTLLLVLGGGPVRANPVQIVHELGTTTVAANPQRVVVFDYGVLDSLDKLGIDVVGLPQADIPSYLSKFNDAKYANVGTLQEPDYEAINALTPDLIIISGRQSAHYDELSRLAPTVYMGIDNDDYVASMQHNMRSIGRIFSAEDEVETELAAMQQAIEKVRSLAADQNALILLVTGGRANAYGPGSRYGFIHNELGLEPATRAIVESTHGQVISWEFVLVHDPDFLFVVDRDAVVSGGSAQAAQQIVENELVRLTTAYARGNIVYLDPSYWYLSGGGFTSFAMMVDDIEQALSRAVR